MRAKEVINREFNRAEAPKDVVKRVDIYSEKNSLGLGQALELHYALSDYPSTRSVQSQRP